MFEEKTKLYSISEKYFSDELRKKLPYRKPVSSWKLVSWSVKHSNLKGIAKLISIQIASYYNPTLGYCFPSYSTLAKETGLNRSTIFRNVETLKLSGEWVVIPVNVEGGNNKQSNRYYPLSPLKDDDFIEDHKSVFWVPKGFNTVDDYEKWLQDNKNKWLSV